MKSYMKYTIKTHKKDIKNIDKLEFKKYIYINMSNITIRVRTILFVFQT